MLKMLSLTFGSSFDEVDCPCRGGIRPNSCRVGQYLRHSVRFENNMSRLTRNVVFRFAVALILLGIFMVLVQLTNPSAISMATATLLIGVLMIAIASFAGL